VPIGVDTPLIEGRLDDPNALWIEAQATVPSLSSDIMQQEISSLPMSIPQSLSAVKPPKGNIKILLNIDFNALSGFLGTGASPTNNMADYSSGYFSGQVGVHRHLRLFQKYNIAKDVTWFIPGHSLETFTVQTKMILDSGAEIGCHGYAHEGGAQTTEQQGRDVVAKCVELASWKNMGFYTV
jgi:hypothetical protein